MIMKIFSIRDAAVEAFLQPFFSPTIGAAIRSVSEAVNDPAHAFHKNAKDYSLWCLGDFDDTNGLVAGRAPPEHVITCIELVQKHLN